jgi:hypothetical protein
MLELVYLVENRDPFRFFALFLHSCLVVLDKLQGLQRRVTIKPNSPRRRFAIWITCLSNGIARAQRAPQRLLESQDTEYALSEPRTGNAMHVDDFFRRKSHHFFKSKIGTSDVRIDKQGSAQMRYSICTTSSAFSLPFTRGMLAPTFVSPRSEGESPVTHT